MKNMKSRLGEEWIEWTCGSLVVERVDIDLQYVLTSQKAQHVLGCIQSSVTSRRGDPAHLLCCYLPSSAVFPVQEKHHPVGVSPEEGQEDEQGWSTSPPGELEQRLSKLGFSAWRSP